MKMCKTVFFRVSITHFMVLGGALLLLYCLEAREGCIVFFFVILGVSAYATKETP